MVMDLLPSTTGREGEFNVGTFEVASRNGASPGAKWQGVPRGLLLVAVALVVIVECEACENEHHNGGDTVSDLVCKVNPAHLEEREIKDGFHSSLLVCKTWKLKATKRPTQRAGREPKTWYC